MLMMMIMIEMIMMTVEMLVNICRVESYEHRIGCIFSKILRLAISANSKRNDGGENSILHTHLLSSGLLLNCYG
jgi:hypothetical protein